MLLWKMSENTALPFVSGDNDFASFALIILHWVQNSPYWTWNLLEKAGI